MEADIEATPAERRRLNVLQCPTVGATGARRQGHGRSQCRGHERPAPHVKGWPQGDLPSMGHRAVAPRGRLSNSVCGQVMHYGMTGWEHNLPTSGSESGPEPGELPPARQPRLALNGLRTPLLWSSRTIRKRRGHQFDRPRVSCRLATAVQFELFGPRRSRVRRGATPHLRVRARGHGGRGGASRATRRRQSRHHTPGPSRVHLIFRWRSPWRSR
jgi:hypothetical protein